MLWGRDITIIFWPVPGVVAILVWLACNPGRTLTMEVPGDCVGVADRCCCMMTNFWAGFPPMFGVVGVRGRVSPGWIRVEVGVCGVPPEPDPLRRMWGFPYKNKEVWLQRKLTSLSKYKALTQTQVYNKGKWYVPVTAWLFIVNKLLLQYKEDTAQKSKEKLFLIIAKKQQTMAGFEFKPNIQSSN